MKIGPVVAALFLCQTASVPALAQAVIPALPKEMLGVWGFKTEDCEDENGDGRLIVEKKACRIVRIGIQARRNQDAA